MGTCSLERIILRYSLLQDIRIWNVVSQFNDVAKRGGTIIQGVNTTETIKKQKNTITSNEAHIYDQRGIHLKKLKPFNFLFCPPNKPGVIFENIEKHCHSKVIGCFFKFFHAQMQNGLVRSVNTFADYKTMLNRPASNIRFILHGNLQSKKITLWYSLLHDSRICDAVFQFNNVAKRGDQLVKELEQLKQ